jgi:hypothetical protein
VTRSAGSKGKADLVAFFEHHTYAVQVKRRMPSKAEIRDLIEMSKLTAAIWVLVYWNGGLKNVYCWKKGRVHKVYPPGLKPKSNVIARETALQTTTPRKRRKK